MAYEAYNFPNGVPRLEIKTAIKFNIKDIMTYEPDVSLSPTSSVSSSTSSLTTEASYDSDVDIVGLSPVKKAATSIPTRANDENPHSRPVYSYNALIVKALRESGDKRKTLRSIYDYIIQNFPFYRTNKQTWQNAIRYNLSVGEYFVKTPRSFNEPGKGNYWNLDESQGEVIIEESSGNVIRRKSSPAPKADPLPVHAPTPAPVPVHTYAGLGFGRTAPYWQPTANTPRSTYSRYNPYAPPTPPTMVPSQCMAPLPALFPPSVVYGMEQLYGNPSATAAELYHRAKYDLQQQYIQRHQNAHK